MAILIRKRKAKPEATQVTRALAIGGELFFDGDDPGMRSSAEREFRALQRGATGVSDSGLTNIVATSVVVFACLEWIANQAAQVPLMVANPQGVESEHFGPFGHFISKQSSGIISDSVRSLFVWGKFFLRKHYNNEDHDIGYPTGLEFINPNNITQNVDHNDVIIDYTIRKTNETIPKEQIIYDAKFDYGGDGNPLSNVEAVFVEAGIQAGLATFAAGFFFNQALPVGVVSFPKLIGDNQYALAKEEWRKNFRGAVNAHKTAILNTEIIWTPIQAAMKDLAMDGLDDASKQKICAGMGVNPAVVGLGDVAAGLAAQSTYQDTVKATIAGTILPAVEVVTGALTSQWSAADFSPPNYYIIAANRQAMPIFSEVTGERVSSATALVSSYIVDRDEARKQLGLPPLENSEQRIFVLAPPGEALAMFDAGAISLGVFERIVGIPSSGVNYWKVDGKVIPGGFVSKYLKDTFNNPVIEPPSFFSDAEIIPETTMQEMEADTQPLSLPAPTLSPARAAIPMRGMLAADFAGHNIIKMARRALGKLITDEPSVIWVNDAQWRLDVLAMEDCNPAIIAKLMQGLDLANRQRVDMWTGEFTIRDSAIWLEVDTPESFTGLRDSVSAELHNNFEVATFPAGVTAIKLADVVDLDASAITEHSVAAPLVITNISLFVDGQKKHGWQLERVTEAQRSELKGWQQKVTRAAKRGKIANFVIETLPEHVACYINEKLAMNQDGAPPADIGAIFSEARKRLEKRAIQATRIDFELFVENVLAEAIAGNIDRNRFASLMRAEINRFGKLAYRDGLIDGGVLDGVPDEQDLERINQLLAEGRSFVGGLADAIYKDDKVTPAEAVGKPAQWYRGAIVPLYQGGRLSADKNGMYEFTGLPGADSCPDCQRLEGQVHRLKGWEKRNLLVPQPGQSTECEGWQCNHILAPTSARAKGSF